MKCQAPCSNSGITSGLSLQCPQDKPKDDPEEMLRECSLGQKEINQAETEDQTDGTLEDTRTLAPLWVLPRTWVLGP